MKYLTVLVCVCLTTFSSQLSLYDYKDQNAPESSSKTYTNSNTVTLRASEDPTHKSSPEDRTAATTTDDSTTVTTTDDSTTVTTTESTTIPSSTERTTTTNPIPSIPPQKRAKYKLVLTINEDKFIGNLNIYREKHNSAQSIKIKINSVALSISNCTCQSGSNKIDCELKLTDPENNKNDFQITFKNTNQLYDDLQLQLNYEGNYSQSGLHDFRALGKGIYYFANLKSYGDPKIGNLLPYIDEDNVQKDEIEIEATDHKFLPDDSNTGEPAKVLKTSLEFHEPFVIGKMKKFSKNRNINCYGSENETYNTDNGLQLLQKLTEDFENIFHNPKYPAIQLLVPTYLSEEMNTDTYITQRDSNMHNLEGLSTFRKQSAQLALIYRFSQKWTENEEKWLSLGLAAFFSNYYIEEVNKEINKGTKFSVLDQFIVDQLQTRAFQFDGYNFSKSLNYFTKTSQSYEQYDPILYSKGASVMMALMEICGENFGELLKNYFKEGDRSGVDKFAKHFSGCFDNAEHSENYFMTLNNEPGYPVIHITSENNKTKIQQETFCWTNNTQTDASWTLALKYKTASEEKTIWLNNMTIYVEGKDIFIVNSKGYFRVNYERKKWEEIIAGLNKNGTLVENERVRARLINDLFSFARSTKQFSVETPDYETALSLKDYLKNESQYLPLKAAFKEFEFLDFALYGGQIHEKFREHIKEIVQNLYVTNGLTSTSEDSFHPLKIKTIASWACTLKVDACIKDAQEEYLKLSNSSVASVPFNETHEVTLCTVLRSNDTAWISAFGALDSRDIHSKLVYINALGCSNKPENLKKLFDYGLNSPFFSECVSAIQAGGPENIAVLLKEIETNFQKIINQMGHREIVNVIKSFYGKLNDKNAATLKKISEKVISADEIKSEVKTVFEEITTWKNMKTKLLADYLNGVAQATPIAQVLFLSTVLSVTNYIFQFNCVI